MLLFKKHVTKYVSSHVRNTNENILKFQMVAFHFDRCYSKCLKCYEVCSMQKPFISCINIWHHLFTISKYLICFSNKCNKKSRRQISFFLQVQLAALFCVEAHARADRLANELVRGGLGTQDLVTKKIAETMFLNNGYCAEHPLKRNSWLCFY